MDFLLFRLGNSQLRKGIGMNFALFSGAIETFVYDSKDHLNSGTRQFFLLYF